MQSLDVAPPLPVTTVFDVYCLYKQQAERRAKVALLTQDTMGYLTPRLEAMRDAFNRMPGVTIVADIAPNPGSKENPDVDAAGINKGLLGLGTPMLLAATKSGADRVMMAKLAESQS